MILKYSLRKFGNKKLGVLAAGVAAIAVLCFWQKIDECWLMYRFQLGNNSDGYKLSMRYGRNGDIEKSNIVLDQLVNRAYPPALSFKGQLEIAGKVNGVVPADGISLLNEAAKAGDFGAMIALGTVYEEGIIVERSYDRATAYYLRGATMGDSRCQTRLAILAFSKKNSAISEGDGFSWALKAATQNLLSAERLVAYCYEKGIGTPLSPQNAFHWAERAANSGDLESMKMLASYYSQGFGTDSNFEKAQYWNKKIDTATKVK